MNKSAQNTVKKHIKQIPNKPVLLGIRHDCSPGNCPDNVIHDINANKRDSGIYPFTKDLSVSLTNVDQIRLQITFLRESTQNSSDDYSVTEYSPLHLFLLLTISNTVRLVLLQQRSILLWGH